MKAADPKVFDKDYYYNICLGADEFKRSKGKALHPKVKKMIDSLPLTSSMNVLEIGSGRGDASLYMAKRVKSITGIDYSIEGVNIAKKLILNFPKSIQKKANFFVMNVKKLNFKDNSFDMVIFIDTFDHLEKIDLEHAMIEINRVLKKDGLLFIRTCSNKILLSYTYPYYIRPLNFLLTLIDQKIKGIKYSPLPKNPRTKEAKEQHVNEPTFFYLKSTLEKFGFEGKIKSEVGFLKELSSSRSHIYNFLVSLYPLSLFFPLNILFAHSYSTLCKKIRFNATNSEHIGKS